MADYDIEGVKPISRTSKADEFRDYSKKQQQKKKKSKSSTSFWDVPTQYTTEDNKNLSYNYSDLEKELEVESEKWGVEKISSQIIAIIKSHYHKFADNNPNYKESNLFEIFYPHAKESLKQAYHQAENVLPPLPQDIEKLIVAAYSKSIDKLDIWRENISNKYQIEPQERKKEEITSKNLIKEISNLLIELGIYLEEQKLNHPIINTTR